MAGPLLETKLHVPRGRRGLVARPRLSERLSRSAESALTLVSAPAGFGKTTLLTEWLAATAAENRSRGVARRWTTGTTTRRCSGRTSSPRCRAAEPGLGAGALALLQRPAAVDGGGPRHPAQRPRRRRRRTSLLVLDDFHVIEAPEVQDGMAFLLEHLPAQVHLVIATRADPPLPLARLRARGELVEIRAADLRFTADEAAAYLNGAMGLALTGADVAALEGRTEGWIAALQLAALSLQGRDDVAGFIAGFAGDDRYIVDYLVEEVLQRQPDDVRSFLLQTSVLSRLNGRLCDAVTGRDGGKAMLAALERGNLFLVPARRPSPVVPLPPPVRRRAARAPARRATRPGPCAAPAGERLVRAARRTVRGGAPRAGRRGRRAGGGAGRTRDPRSAAQPAGGHAATLARGAARRAAPGPAGADHGRGRLAHGPGRSRGRGGAAAAGRAVAGPGDRPGRDGRRRRGGVPHAPDRDRDVPRRNGPGPG